MSLPLVRPVDSPVDMSTHATPRTYEVITYGGGANYRDIFIGVALLCGTDAMSSLIRLAMLLGLIMVLFVRRQRP